MIELLIGVSLILTAGFLLGLLCYVNTQYFVYKQNLIESSKEFFKKETWITPKPPTKEEFISEILKRVEENEKFDMKEGESKADYYTRIADEERRGVMHIRDGGRIMGRVYGIPLISLETQQ